MPSSKSNGSQSATLDTEHTLLDTTDAGNYELTVDLNNMANGDVLVLRVYVKVRSAGTLRVVHEGVYAHAQGDEKVARSPVVASVHQYKATLEQTDGTGRSYNWEVVEL